MDVEITTKQTVQSVFFYFWCDYHLALCASSNRQKGKSTSDKQGETRTSGTNW